MASERELHRWAEALAGVAQTGLAFTENPYERERYEEILLIAGDIKATAEDSSTAESFVTQWRGAVRPSTAGYVTPKVAVGAIVTNEHGQILLIQRSDSGVWLYPTGWCDVGYSAPEVVLKEIREETGLEAEVVRLVGVIDGMQLGASKTPLYSLLFLCRATGGTLRHHPHECLDVGWFDEDALPTNTLGSERWVPGIFRHIRGETTEVLYDDVRKPVWKEPRD